MCRHHQEHLAGCYWQSSQCDQGVTYVDENCCSRCVERGVQPFQTHEPLLDVPDGVETINAAAGVRY